MARDKYHELVKAALVKERWLITDDPLIVEAGKRKIQVDLGAERLIAAEKDGEKIAIEIKSFIGVSTLHDFYQALGQFSFYKYALEKKMPERTLFLAVPDDTYEDFFKEDFITELLARYQVKMLVYRIDEATIERWIN
ncbi:MULTISPECIES: element excision factor XisH family protein [Moorena]|uniref:Element excision factor XisH family protein n=3 Tax=Moorena TaxID=1155738 RepID=A0A1D9G7G2_MOOP1|nr:MULTISPECIES: element excision factor XisH family protein [Moorena]NEQ18229.1 fatty-acid oxidation protein subunit alpha [Moorena sp. SIO3E2]NES85253.1 fatty-acid oxidation protein subunit alpha [Moorena sp. SIO2B7]AOY83579.1 element excision factor XisH family protein [Moorena producens JHB]EGJ30084.1 XisH protein [Moorena producens 3L]NEP30490.1 fatty-acid oxidation protein subunit alpha [Moorena sp. SIO3B2]